MSDFVEAVHIGSTWKDVRTGEVWKVDGLHLNTLKQAMIELRLFQHLITKVITSDTLYKDYRIYKIGENDVD